MRTHKINSEASFRKETSIRRIDRLLKTGRTRKRRPDVEQRIFDCDESDRLNEKRSIWFKKKTRMLQRKDSTLGMNQGDLVVLSKRKIEADDVRPKKEHEKSDLDFFVVYRPWESFLKEFLTPLDLYMLRSTCRMLRKMISKKPITRNGIKCEEIYCCYTIACKEGNFLLGQFLWNQYHPGCEWNPDSMICSCPRTSADLKLQLDMLSSVDPFYMVDKLFEAENMGFLLQWNSEYGIQYLANIVGHADTTTRVKFVRRLLLASFSAETPIYKLVEKIGPIGILTLGSLEIFKEWEKRRNESGDPIKKETFVYLDWCVPFGSIELLQYLFDMYNNRDVFHLTRRTVTEKRPDLLRYIRDQNMICDLSEMTLTPSDLETSILLLEWKQKSRLAPKVKFDWDQVSDVEFAKFLLENKLLNPSSSVFVQKLHIKELVWYYIDQGFPTDSEVMSTCIGRDYVDLFDHCCRSEDIDHNDVLHHIIIARAWKILERIKTSSNPEMRRLLSSFIETLKNEIRHLRPFHHPSSCLKWYKDNVGPKIPKGDVDLVLYRLSKQDIDTQLVELLVQDEMVGMEIWNSKKNITQEFMGVAVIKTGNLSWLKKIINAGYDISKTNSILSKVAKVDSVEMLDYMIQDLGYQPDWSMVQTAIEHGAHKVFRRLLDLNIGFPEEDFLIALATRYCQPTMVEQLKKRFSDPSYLHLRNRK